MATRFLTLDGKIAKDTRTGMPVAITTNIFTSVTYDVLKTMRDNGHLLSGEQYRIVDFVTTTTQENTQSAGHPFDIIVVADSANTLNENARAVAHAGDTYFANSKLSAWEIKYSFDNDKTRFWWALDGQGIVGGFDGGLLTRQPSFDGQNPTENDQYSKYYYAWGTQLGVDDGDPMNFLYSENETINDGETLAVGDYLEQVSVVSGKGVIYYMKDEYDNECPYDFKNIQFKRWQTDTELENDDKFYSSWDDTGNDFRWCYTFMANGLTNDTWVDASIIKPHKYMSDEGAMPCVNNTLKSFIEMYEGSEETNSIEGIKWLNNIVLYGGYEDNPIISDNYEYNYIQCPCGNNFGINNHSMTLGKIQGCTYNIFGDDCSFNTFGSGSGSNTFGNGCRYNTFGNINGSNTFGHGCSNNIFGDGCRYNTFGNDCNSTFGEHCTYNIFGNECTNNTFGGYCSFNIFGSGCSLNTFGDFCSYNIVDNGVREASPQPTTAGGQRMQGVHIHYGVTGQFTVVRGANYTQDVRTANDVTITV